MTPSNVLFLCLVLGSDDSGYQRKTCFSISWYLALAKLIQLYRSPGPLASDMLYPRAYWMIRWDGCCWTWCYIDRRVLGKRDIRNWTVITHFAWEFIYSLPVLCGVLSSCLHHDADMHLSLSTKGTWGWLCISWCWLIPRLNTEISCFSAPIIVGYSTK